MRLLRELRQRLVALVFRHKNHFRAAEQIEEQVALVLLRFVARQHENATQAEPGCGCRHLATMIGLLRAGADECLATICQGISSEIFQLAGLIPAKSEPRQVIPLDEKTWTSKHFREAGQLLDGGGKMGK